MQSPYLIKHLSAAIAAAFIASPIAAIAADPVKPADKAAMPHAKDKSAMMPADKAAMAGTPHDRMAYSDRENMKPWKNDKDQLEAALKLGEGKDFYAKTLADNGYQITSINADKADYVEYEVVKGKHSYEVQIDLEGGKAKKVDVATNMWRAASTKAAMRGEKTAAATKYDKANDTYSDRARMKGWSGEKDKLEKSLALGHDKAYYTEQLKKMGYQITATNDNEKDYLEYEVVKGKDSYEVQIDLEAGKAKKIDVATNMWQAEATERALDGKKK